MKKQKANNPATKTARRSSSELAPLSWVDALARLADEMERKEEWWRNVKDDPHNIATGLMVAFAEIKTALRTISEEARGASNEKALRPADKEEMEAERNNARKTERECRALGDDGSAKYWNGVADAYSHCMASWSRKK